MFRQFVLPIICLLLSASKAHSQDTVAVYFKVGSHKLSAWSQRNIEKLFAGLDYTDLTAITFIGYSDSTGKTDSNHKLSERRANAVYRFSKRFMQPGIPFSIQSKGEIPRIVDSLSRRVDIIVHYQASSPENDQDTLLIQPDDPRCFFIDQYIEAYSNVMVKLHKKKKVVYLQVLNEKEFTSRKYYYVKNPSKPNAVAQRVNFKLETTGMLWWREKRLTATIPQDSYEKYGLFYLENPPCDGCKEQLFKQDTNVFSGTSIADDYFVMSVTQLKKRLFRPNSLKIRVPKEYIQENESYYAIKKYSYTEKSEHLEWKEKRGKRKANYLFAKISIKDAETISIARPQRVSYCPIVDGGGLYRRGFACGNRRTNSSSPGGFSLLPAVHAFYHNDTLTAFVSVGLSYCLNRHELAANIGINHRLGLYYSAYYHYEIFSFEMMRNRLLDPWQKINESRTSKHVGIYAGPEFRSSYTKRYRSFSEVNIHAGFSVEWNSGFGYYVHGGVARDLENRINTGFYPYIQTGIRFRFEF